MNFLAHIYLSGNPGPLMIGNFIADFVKGKQVERFAPEIQDGIRLHRKIDAFTDSHPVVKQSSVRFKPCYQRYSSVVVDVIYDHFLAKNWQQYSPVPLHTYVSQVHTYLLKNYFVLPNRVKGFLPFLIKSRRLENYQHMWGIQKSLSLMANHSSLPAESECGMKIMSEQYAALEKEFKFFFTELRQMVEKELAK
ncbi:Acyl carrier protein phosphodiesterase [Saccharicrinis carchari]|uniref:Acyl carrier protein phosphodiesterase n=1 Tax=Saccharicrinis carchari TaxID=1168039 RepID=A0A521CJ69_SACCC|nr:ACP phosphodiesterase [Saccharicrinis carchari]SMO59442.1 Acyl carrier protein phosphodiesterase [Saccharicrinis carchari]